MEGTLSTLRLLRTTGYVNFQQQHRLYHTLSGTSINVLTPLSPSNP